MKSRCLFIAFCFALISLSYAQTEKMKTWEAEGDTLLDHENFDGALKAFSKIIKASKEKDKFYYSILYKTAISYYSLGRFDEALKALNEFVPAYPSFPQAYLLRAFIFREKEDSEGQLTNLEEAMKLQPGNPDVLKWRAQLYMDENKYELAKKDLKQVRFIQDDPEVETYLGLAYFNTDQPDSAFISLKKSMELDATYQPAYLYAGSFSLQNEQYNQALTYLNLALRLDPKNYTALFYKGVALIEKEKINEGCSCLAKAFYTGKIDDAGDYLKQYCYGEEN